MEIQVPKTKVCVEVMFETKPGEVAIEKFLIFLNKFSPNHRGEESLDEFLNSGRHFIPMVVKSSEDFFILNLDAVFYVKELELSEKNVENELALHFNDETIIDVGSYELLPQFRSRPLDYFNTANQFLVFLHEGHCIYVNKSNIRKVATL